MKSLLAALLLLVLLSPLTLAAGKRSDEVQRLQRAAAVFKEVMATPDRAIPDDLLDRAECVAVIPGLKKGALGFGGKYGKGVLTCRKSDRHWSAPSFITVEGGSGEHVGRVARLSPAIHEQNRTLTIEAEIPNERGVLRPGSFARASIMTKAGQPIVMVPASAIVTFAGIEKVMSVKDGKSVERRVQTGRRDGDRIEVVSGLAAGEPVVIEPGNLTGGQAVTVVR